MRAQAGKGIAIAMCLALSACGGGGGDGAEPGNGGPGGSSGGDTMLINLSGLSGAEDSTVAHAFTVPAGTTGLQVRTSGGSGDLDILVTAPGAAPCSSTASTNNELCEFTAPAPRPKTRPLRRACG